MNKFIFSTNTKDDTLNGTNDGIYATDGTAAGTINIGQYEGEPYGSAVATTVPVFNGMTYYVESDYAGSGASLLNLITTDGTVAGTKTLMPLENTENSVPTDVWSLGSTLIAAGSAGNVFMGPVSPVLWASTDGVNFTQITTDVSAENIYNANGAGYFAAVNDSGNMNELWRTNGTTHGTYEITTTEQGVTPVNFAPTSTDLTVFTEEASAGADTLWSTDGTNYGTQPIDVPALGYNIMGSVGTISVNGKAIFAAVDTSGQYSVWATDGTTPNTVEIGQFGFQDDSIRPILNLTAWGNKVIITTGYGLYVTGSAGSTMQNINPWELQLGTLPPGAFITLGNKLILASPVVNVNGVDTTSTLYVSDGTNAGTVALHVAGLRSFTGDFTVVGSQVVLVGLDNSGREAFFSTDGTSSGSHELAVPTDITIDPSNLPAIEAVIVPAPLPKPVPIPVEPIPVTPSIVTLGGGAQSYVAVSGATVQAGSGGDSVTATSGNVTVSGSSGHLTFFGGTAASSVFGGSGSATIFGGAGGGIVVGGAAGHNVLVSQGTNSTMTTMTGMGSFDQIFGSAAGSDVITAGSGRDSILGGGGLTTINGGGTGSVIFTGTGPTTVNGGAGGLDTIVGGSGALSVIAQRGDAVFGNTGALDISGSLSGADSLIGGSGTISVEGRGANMLVVAGTGASNVTTGDGASLVFAGSGNLSLVGGAGSMQVVTGSGNATIIEGSGPTTLQIVNGAAGGVDVISGFRPGTDSVELFGYTAAQQTVTMTTGSTVLSLFDGTKITLLEGVMDLSG